MTSYDFAAVESLRWQLARYFPELNSNNRFSCIQRVDSHTAAEASVKKRPEGQPVEHSDNVQAVIWLQFKEASLLSSKISPINMKTARRLRQLYIQYRELVWETDKEIVADDPVIYKMMQYMYRDLDRAVSVLQAALESRQAAETMAYSRSLDEWKQTWQEKRQLAETTPGDVPDATKAAVPSPETTVQLPLPPPLPPCLQCVLANTCCSLTTTPYTRAYVDDVARLSGKSGISERPQLQTILDEHARLTAVHGRCDGKESELASSATLTEKKCAYNQQLLLEAVVRGDCDSPFLPDPPVQCTRCQRLGHRDCLQQSRDLTGTTDTLALDSDGHHQSAWFASSGPPPRSLLRQHCLPLLRQMTESALSVAGPPDKTWPVLEAIYCRDKAVLTAVQVAEKAKKLLKRIHRRNKWRMTAETGSDAEPMMPTSPTSPKSPKSPTAASSLPQICKEPVPAVAPTILARRLPKHSVYAGERLATAVSEAEAEAEEQASTRWQRPTEEPALGAKKPGQTVRGEEMKDRLARCKESLGKTRQASTPARGTEAPSREQLEKLAGMYGISVTMLDRMIWRKGR